MNVIKSDNKEKKGIYMFVTKEKKQKSRYLQGTFRDCPIAAILLRRTSERTIKLPSLERANKMNDLRHKYDRETVVSWGTIGLRGRQRKRCLGSTRKCEACGKEYALQAENQKYCGRKCRNRTNVSNWKRYHWLEIAIEKGTVAQMFATIWIGDDGIVRMLIKYGTDGPERFMRFDPYTRQWCNPPKMPIIELPATE
jgi:hypothetical protein